jgi:hypothetical protein
MFISKVISYLFRRRSKGEGAKEKEQRRRRIRDRKIVKRFCGTKNIVKLARGGTPKRVGIYNFLKNKSSFYKA